MGCGEFIVIIVESIQTTWKDFFDVMQKDHPAFLKSSIVFIALLLILLMMYLMWKRPVV